jgi:hypothetical protein
MYAYIFFSIGHFSFQKLKLFVPGKNPLTDHVVVIAGYGEDEESGLKYWIGRNSYGTAWGEGAGRFYYYYYYYYYYYFFSLFFDDDYQRGRMVQA